MTDTTNQDTFSAELIQQARRRYLAAHPLRTTEPPTIDAASGAPGELWMLPNISDVQIVGCKLGMEYLAICHDDEAVEDWIHTALGIVKDPELAGILFANVFRGVNVVIGEIINNAGLQQRMQQLAIEAWGREFSSDEAAAGGDGD